MRAPTAQRYQRPRRREHDHHDQRGAQNQQQEVAELQPASALSLRRAQIANRWEIELGGNASLHQVKQCRDRGSGESQERSEEHTSELQSRLHLVCRLLLEKKKKKQKNTKAKIDVKDDQLCYGHLIL